MSATVAESVVARMAACIADGDVVATGVASPLAILAIAVARATHAPRLSYLACVGALDPVVARLQRSSEDLAYLDGRAAEIGIPDLFDHARRGRIDLIFFGAAEADPSGATNMSAVGSLQRPRPKLPGLAGAATLRRWVRRPVLVMPRHGKRSLVPRVQVASTRDPDRPIFAITDLAELELGPTSAILVARHPWATAADIAERTGFSYATASELGTTPPPSAATLEAIRRLDPIGLREELVPDPFNRKA